MWRDFVRANNYLHALMGLRMEALRYGNDSYDGDESVKEALFELRHDIKIPDSEKEGWRHDVA